MKNTYKSDYSCVALITEKGNTLTTKSASYFGTAKLTSSPIGSIEYCVNKLNIDSCFLSMDRFTCSDILKIRFMGNKQRTKQFSFIIPKSRMDGVIFIKNATNIIKSKKILKKDLSPAILMLDSYQEALKKIRKIVK